jgi:Ulp1 family protease
MVDMLKMDDEIKITWLRNVIKQKNSYDCGIYVVGNIEIILS